MLENFGQLARTIYILADQTESENLSLAAMRDALLPRLVSGEVGVNWVEDTVSIDVSQLVWHNPKD